MENFQKQLSIFFLVLNTHELEFQISKNSPWY